MLHQILIAGLIGAAPTTRAAPAAPQNLSAVFTEKSIELRWDSVPGAEGYNVYSSPSPAMPLAKRRKVNAALITSGVRFTYMWDIENGARIRRIKGYAHYLSVTAVQAVKGKLLESKPSQEIDNRYFDGFSRVWRRADIERILAPAQTTAPLPVAHQPVTREAFIAFMEGPGSLLMKLIADTLDFRETGGCAPVSTVLVNLMNRAGLYALRIEGLFIKEFHTFVIVNIDGVEYVLDFTADQFVPGVSPVFLPRDKAFLNERGKLDTSGVPIYQPARIYTPHQSVLSAAPEAAVYRAIFERVIKESGL